MCGIAGFAGPAAGGTDADATLRAMCGAIVHRGPDEEGRWSAPSVGLGMRRLSVIDVAGGTQPIANEDGTVTVVFNGEIYNFRELRDRLRARGHRLATRSDTETLVHLYEDHGDDLVHDLRGMFGFALWDARRERLLVARDRLGIKPLYVWEHGGGVAFASELRSFLALPHFPRTLAPAAVAAYLSLGYVPDPLCVFAGVHKLPPGHRLSWDRAHGVRIERWWAATAVDAVAVSEDEAVEELRRLLDEAVTLHLESDVPLGAFLSGGIDSSTVVAHMARRMDRPVKTFSIGFEEREYNEAGDAERVAAALRTDHTTLIVRPDADALVEEVVTTFDEPFADSSALPTYLVSHLARQHVTVALSGDGGDELFAGYTRYAQHAAQGPALPAAARAALRAAGRLLPAATPGRNRLLDLARTRQGRYAATVALPLDPVEGGLARGAIARAGDGLDALLAPHFAEAAGFDGPTQLSLVDLATYLPGDILTKVDRASMAFSLEARVPLLDHKLVEFALSLPGPLKLGGGVGKRVLRRAIAGVVPPLVLEKRKQGFGVPLEHWFRRELRPRLDAIQRDDARVAEWVDVAAVRRLVREHLAGRRDQSLALWRVLALELWLGALARGDLARPLQSSPALAALTEAR